MKGLWIRSLVLAATVVLAGCGAVYLPSSSTSTSAPASSASTPGAVGSPPVASSSGASSSSSDAPMPAPSRVTLQDSGKAITMHVGDTFLLALGEQQWNVTVADQTVLARMPNIMVVRGAQGVYRALKAGTTTLSATGTAPCNTGQVCPMYAIAFHLTVQVQA